MSRKNGPYPYYDLPPVSNFQELIESQANKSPDQPAFVWKERKEEKTKTRREYERDVKALAAWLIENNLAKSHVAIASGNCYEWVVLFAALQLVHSCAVPINPGLEAKEITDMLVRSDCDAVFHSKACSKFTERIPQNIQVFHIEEIGEYTDKYKDRSIADLTYNINREYPVNPNHLAAIFFTSGTTGDAKGVMLTEKNFCSDMNSSCESFVFSGNTVALLPFYHSFGLMTSVYMALNWNGTVYISKNMRRIVQDMQAAGPQTLCVVPLVVETIHKRINESLKKTGRQDKVKKAMKLANTLEKIGIDVRRKIFKQILDQVGGKLEYIICGGAMLDETIIEDFHTWGIQILRGYGITEGSPVLSVNRNHFIKKNSVGPLMPGVHGKVSPEGELLFSGDMIFQGYYKDEKQTREALQDGWLHTGDLGYIDEDDFIFITGRSKNLIILSNGENISPEQIEQILLRDEAVCECVVIEKQGHLCAVIYPEKDWLGDEEYFQKLIHTYNLNQPSDRQIVSVILRKQEFEKNAMQKILRRKVEEEYKQSGK